MFLTVLVKATWLLGWLARRPGTHSVWKTAFNFWESFFFLTCRWIAEVIKFAITEKALWEITTVRPDGKQSCSNQELTFYWGRYRGLELRHRFILYENKWFDFLLNRNLFFFRVIPSTPIGSWFLICWKHRVHFHLCYHRNRILLVKLGFVVCVLLTINTPFMHDLWLCWVSPFRQMIVAQKGALGRWHLIFTTSPETSKWELCFFTLCSRSALWHPPDLAGDLPPIIWIDLILFHFS